MPIPGLTPTFDAIDFSSRTSVLATAQVFEDLGVSTYNGARQFMQDDSYLVLAGKIVSVEARHASVISGLHHAEHDRRQRPDRHERPRQGVAAGGRHHGGLCLHRGEHRGPQRLLITSALGPDAPPTSPSHDLQLRRPQRPRRRDLLAPRRPPPGRCPRPHRRFRLHPVPQARPRARAVRPLATSASSTTRSRSSTWSERFTARASPTGSSPPRHARCSTPSAG